MELSNEFVQRVLQRSPAPGGVREYVFVHWNTGRPTDEGVGVLPVPGADAEAVLRCVFDVDHYVGNVGHVVECRAIADPAHVPPQRVRFYQRIKIPLLGEVHHELALERIGNHAGYEIAAWQMLERQSAALDRKVGIRSQYNEGAWLVAPGVVGYALNSAPRKDDVSFLAWKALTTGANVAASKVIRDNIEAMSAWAARSR